MRANANLTPSTQGRNSQDNKFELVVGELEEEVSTNENIINPRSFFYLIE